MFIESHFQPSAHIVNQRNFSSVVLYNQMAPALTHPVCHPHPPLRPRLKQTQPIYCHLHI